MNKILFLDIETVALEKNYSSLNDNGKDLWDKKSSFFRKEDSAENAYLKKAGIYSEFSKVICISMGILEKKEENNFQLKVKSFSSKNETELLENFIKQLQKLENYSLCAHNGKEFDFPFLARRILIQGLNLPQQLNIMGKKPWEINHIDTMEMWKFGDYKHFTSLELLSYIFNIESPKSNISGEDIHDIFYGEKKGYLEKITRYCEKDVETLVKVYLKLSGKNATLEITNVK